jgi:hypothetical protein
MMGSCVWIKGSKCERLMVIVIVTVVMIENKLTEP